MIPAVVRRRSIRLALYALVALLLAALAFDPGVFSEGPGAGGRSPHHLATGFRNLSEAYDYTLATRARGLFRRHRPRPIAGLPVVANDGAALRANGHEPSATWVGHSTFLVQLDGVNILTDPHWGDRTSPVRFAGPRRLVPPGIRFEDLPGIDVVLISHDHYDHLDEATVRLLAREHRPRFVVPLGIGRWLRERGIDDVVELDWWAETTVRGLTIVCTPAQHSSGRGLRDQNLRLWSSWVVQGKAKRFFFAGDTGYYPGLREISRLGPFDLAFIPLGGYSDYRYHHPNHLNPEEAVQVLQDVDAAVMVPMHWGTFDLNREPFDEPPRRLMAEAIGRGVENRIVILRPGQSIPW